MSSVNPTADDLGNDISDNEKRERRFARIARAAVYFDVLGLGWLVPLLRIAAGDSPRYQLRELWQLLFVPLLGIIAFVALWASVAPQINTSLGAVPGPAQVWEQVGALWEDHKAEREKAERFYERQAARNDKLVAAGKADRVKWRDYTGKPTYLDQIGTSLKTVAFGFLVATLIAVPLGIASGPALGADAGRIRKVFDKAVQIMAQVFTTNFHNRRILGSETGNPETDKFKVIVSIELDIAEKLFSSIYLFHFFVARRKPNLLVSQLSDRITFVIGVHNRPSLSFTHRRNSNNLTIARFANEFPNSTILLIK